MYLVVSILSVDKIIALIPVQHIVSRPAVYRVGINIGPSNAVFSTIDDVIPDLPIYVVPTEPPIDMIIAFSAVNAVIAVGSADVVVAHATKNCNPRSLSYDSAIDEIGSVRTRQR